MRSIFAATSVHNSAGTSGSNIMPYTLVAAAIFIAFAGASHSELRAGELSDAFEVLEGPLLPWVSRLFSSKRSSSQS
eukprot:scaffold973_cov399-Prasinococcus_capsulatus_cf.AAC.2